VLAALRPGGEIEGYADLDGALPCNAAVTKTEFPNRKGCMGAKRFIARTVRNLPFSWWETMQVFHRAHRATCDI